MTEKPEQKTIFFDVLLEIDNKWAILVPSWRIYDNRIHPPAKEWKRHYYASILLSEDVAKLVFDALVTQGYTELDHDGWVSAKWGKSGLEKVMSGPEEADALWKKYRKQGK